MKIQWPGARGWVVGIGSAVVAFVLPFVVPHAEEHHGWWAAIPGWWTVYGFFGCAGIVFVSKALGSWILQKREDWYD